MELIISAVATLEEAMAARAVSTGIPADTSMMEKRRAWDRDRKRRKKMPGNSTGIPPDSTGIPPERRSILKIEVIGTQEVVEEKKESKSERKNTRGTRIPPEFSIDDGDRAFAVSLGIPPEMIEAETPQFIDYWSGIPGQRGVKLNWKGTWRNRMRDVAKKLPTKVSSMRPLTEFQRGRNETRDILNDLDNFAKSGDGGQADTRLLPGDSGQRSERLRGGSGGDVIDLPATGYRSRG